MIILGNRYKLLNEDISKIKNSFSSYYQVNIDEEAESNILKIIHLNKNISTVILNLDKKLSVKIQIFLENLEYTNKIKVTLFSANFIQKYIQECQKEENLKHIH